VTARVCGWLMARRRCANEEWDCHHPFWFRLCFLRLSSTSCCLISSLAFPCASLRHSASFARLLIGLSSCFATHMSPFNNPSAKTHPHPHTYVHPPSIFALNCLRVFSFPFSFVVPPSSHKRLSSPLVVIVYISYCKLLAAQHRADCNVMIFLPLKFGTYKDLQCP
jgi:hypothetical protein